MKKVLKTLLAVMAFSQIACETSDETPELVIPSTYDASQFEINTTTERTVLTNLQAAVNEINKGRTGNKINEAVVRTAFDQIKPVTTTYYADYVDTKIKEVVSISGGQQFKTDGSQGGVYGVYLFNQYGLENEQLIDKGLYGATLYNHAVKLTETPDATTADKLLAIMGTSPAFPNSNNGNIHPKPDSFMANYIARRDKNDGNGFYSIIQNNLIKLQAATKAGSAYNIQRDEAINAILENWEMGNAATAINYLQSVQSNLSSTNVNEATVASAMHSFSEAVAFLYGFKTISKKQITEAELDEVLTLLNVPPGKTPTTLNILVSPVTELVKMQQAIDKLKGIYGFTNQQIEDFKKNWVSEQGR